MLLAIGCCTALIVALVALATMLGNEFNLWSFGPASAPRDSWLGTHVTAYYLIILENINE